MRVNRTIISSKFYLIRAQTGQIDEKGSVSPMQIPIWVLKSAIGEEYLLVFNRILSGRYGTVKAIEYNSWKREYTVVFYQKNCRELFYDGMKLIESNYFIVLTELKRQRYMSASWAIFGDHFFLGTAVRSSENL